MMMAMAITASAQTIGEAFYIYRNDGDFNAFFREEVDSIVYSNYDNDSIWYDDVVTQVVYTPDSIYRIPLAAIDSVGFVQPEIILQPNVRQMEKEGLMDYLQAVDGMSLLFKTSIPHDMQPEVGEVLMYTQFDSPLLREGFVGKVLTTQMTDNAFVVSCDSIYDLFEVFEQLISIEKLTDKSRNARKEAKGEWKSGQNEVEFDLGFTHKMSDKESVSLSGFVDGTYVATVIYNMTNEDQYINLRVDHDWNYGAKMNFKYEIGSFGPLIGPVISLPAIRFPAMAPFFRFQVSGVPFVKGEGNIELDFSLKSPDHSYVLQAIYNNGHFSGWNHEKPVKENTSPNFETAFSLNGSVQAGIKVDLWLGLDVSIKGFAKDFLKLGTGLDFYIGPQISGDFSMKMGTENPINYYSIYKDSKIGIDWLHVDYEFFGEASLAGHKFPKAIFCEGSLQSPLNHEWYVLPEFSELSVLKDATNRQATIITTPSRDILFPLEVGMGLYDETGRLLDSKYETGKYKRENEGFEIRQSFSSLEENEKYTAKPMFKLFDNQIPAEPSESFKLDMIPVKITNFQQTDSHYTHNGYNHNNQTYDYEFKTSVTVELEDSKNIADWGYAYKDPSDNVSYVSLGGKDSQYTDEITFYSNKSISSMTLYGYVKYKGDGANYNGEATEKYVKHAFLSCPDNNHPHLIDLGLPSGTKWACCNIEADTPEGKGGYYAWGETSEKTVYNDITYQYCTGEDTDGDGFYDSPYQSYVYGVWQNLGKYIDDSNYNMAPEGDMMFSNNYYFGGMGLDEAPITPPYYSICGTHYDVATMRWGVVWQMPTDKQCSEMINYCTHTWTTEKGITGQRFTGKNGGTIFLPAAGRRRANSLSNGDGYYWTGVQGINSNNSGYLFFNSNNTFSHGTHSDGDYYSYHGHRSLGLTVRPISE